MSQVLCGLLSSLAQKIRRLLKRPKRVCHRCLGSMSTVRENGGSAVHSCRIAASRWARAARLIPTSLTSFRVVLCQRHGVLSFPQLSGSHRNDLERIPSYFHSVQESCRMEVRLTLGRNTLLHDSSSRERRCLLCKELIRLFKETKPTISLRNTSLISILQEFSQ